MQIVVPPAEYDSFGGKMAIQTENYIVSDQMLRGNQSWIWTNKDSTATCEGKDHIIGLLGRHKLMNLT